MPAGAAIAGLGAEVMGARGVFAVFAAASILLLVPLTVTDLGIEATEAESSAREARRRMTSAQP